MNAQQQADWVDQALQRYQKPLLRYAYGMTGSVETARDVVQDAFLKLCEADRDKIDDYLRAWLYTVTRNRALNVLKKEARMTPLVEGQAENLPEQGDGPRDHAMASEKHRRIADVLRGLPEQQQEACRLKFQNNLSYREISRIMEVSLGTVSNLIGGAVTSIRQTLETDADFAQEA
jgi:RNA polymerase sigma factor (sigma-70 family)